MARKQSLFWSQSRGLLARSWHYQRRQTCGNACNFIVPPLLLIALYALDKALQPKTNEVLPLQKTPQGAYAAVPFEADQCLNLRRELGSEEAASQACTADPFQNKVTIPYYAPAGSEAVLGGRDAAKEEAYGVLGGLSLSPFIYPEALPGSNSSFSEEQTWYDGVFLNEYGGMDRDSSLYSEFVVTEQRGSLDQAYEMKMQKVRDKASFLRLIFESWFTGGAFTPYKTAYGFKKVSGSKPANLSAEVTVYYNESEQVGANCTKSCQVFSAVQRLDAAYFAAVSPGNTAAAYLRRYPDTGYQAGLNIIGLVISIVLALLLHFFVPFFTGFLVYERQSRLRELMSSSGLRPTTYWFSTYIALLLQYMTMAILVTAIGIGISVPFFGLNEFLTYAILFFIWGNVVVALAIFFAPFFSSTETATVMVWLFVVLVNFVGGPFIGRISSVDGTTEGYWSAVMLLPSFALLRSIYYAGAFNSGGQGVVVGSDQFYQGTNLGMCSGEGPFCRSMLFLVVEWIVLMVVGIYLDQVLPSATGVRKHPLFFLGMKRGRGRGDELLTREIDENELEEVAMERALVTDIVANDPKTSEGIVIDGLHKVYEEAKPCVHAVQGLSFVARHGEITGLLGSNGSGKTSAIRCLIGAHEISGGDAYVSGHSIRTDMPEIHRSLGICLQQDIGWDCLSVREHLFFVGRLRNIPKIELKGAVERAMESVGLTYAAKRKSGQCSGGMRRRLSVAMALLGDPSTIILDELSSGLDPSNAAIVWQAIKEAKAGKTILLTTHSMEEAQVLCDRLHMVTRGSLRTTGNPEELRLRLGRGYRLAAAVPDTKIGDFHDLMMGISPECRIETSLGGSLQYSIPRDVRLSAIFDTMNVNKERLCIRDWGISQSSLEDVFLNIVARDEADLGVTKLIPSSESAWL